MANLEQLQRALTEREKQALWYQQQLMESFQQQDAYNTRRSRGLIPMIGETIFDSIRKKQTAPEHEAALRNALDYASGVTELERQIAEQQARQQAANEQAEMARRAAVAQGAGYEPGQARAVAEGIDLPKQPELPALIQTLQAAGIDPRSPQGQHLIRENLTKSQVSVNTGLPKPQAGFMWNEDQTRQVAIPGTPQAEQAEASQKARSEIEQKRAFSAQNVLSAIDRLKENTSNLTAGWGGLLADVPATAAKTYKNDLNTVMSNLAFDRLQEMRNASKTGGALGQVSNIELELLKSTVAGLEQTQDPDDLRERLDIVAGNYERYVDALSGKVPQGYEVKEIPGRGRFIKVDGQWYPL